MELQNKEQKQPISELSLRKEKRASAELFWKEKKEDCLPIKSVKEVFSLYSVFCKQKNLPILSEYIFRTYIRKQGYGKK